MTMEVERNPTIAMAMAIVTRRQQHSSKSRTGNQHGVANGLDRGHVDVVVDDVRAGIPSAAAEGDTKMEHRQ